MPQSALIEFLGAAGTVTGSKTLVKWNGSSTLIDCGLFQGDKELRALNWQPFAPGVESIDSVILTHAHLDHSGYLPRLYREGYRGPVYCSEGTFDLCKILLIDAAYLEEESALYANESGYSRHKPALPLFNREDAEGAIGLIRPQPRDQWLSCGKGLEFQLIQAGHIIGASSAQLRLNAGSQQRVITFSGDVGHDRSFTMISPTSPETSDVVILESTYGDRLHSREGVMDQFAAIANRTFSRKGVLVIPAFAVGRAQEVLYMLRQLEDQGLIPTVPVILDSPMSQAATKVFLDHPEDHAPGTAFHGGENRFHPKRFEATASIDESMLACMRDGPLVVISAAGMLSGGRILHHLKCRINDERNTVLFVGYQAEGTKGRFLQDNVGKIDTFRIHHREIPLRCEVATMDALSAHGDYEDLLRWLGNMKVKPTKILLNHGTPKAMDAFAELIQKELGVKAEPVKTPQKFKFW